MRLNDGPGALVRLSGTPARHVSGYPTAAEKTDARRIGEWRSSP